jgi:hypothetical protein
MRLLKAMPFLGFMVLQGKGQAGNTRSLVRFMPKSWISSFHCKPWSLALFGSLPCSLPGLAAQSTCQHTML